MSAELDKPDGHEAGCSLLSSSHNWQPCDCRKIAESDRPCVTCAEIAESAKRCRGCADELRWRAARLA